MESSISPQLSYQHGQALLNNRVNIDDTLKQVLVMEFPCKTKLFQVIHFLKT